MSNCELLAIRPPLTFSPKKKVLRDLKHTYSFISRRKLCFMIWNEWNNVTNFVLSIYLYQCCMIMSVHLFYLIAYSFDASKIMFTYHRFRNIYTYLYYCFLFVMLPTENLFSVLLSNISSVSWLFFFVSKIKLKAQFGEWLHHITVMLQN